MAIVTQKIGQHVLLLEDPDIVSVEMVGDLSPAEAADLNKGILQFSTGKPFVFFLANMARFGSVAAEARKVTAKATEHIPYRGMAFFGASFQARVIATLILNAVNLITRRDNPGEFFPSEPDARVWLNQRRQRLSEKV